jgi:hypothetical protein
MRKLLLVCFTLALASAALAGCRAEGEIDPAGGVSYNGPAAR